MSKRAGWALFLSMALLFLIANRGAYRSYFQDDELDTLSWAPYVSNATFLEKLISPRYLSHNFRPVGHFYFHVLGGHFGLDFPKYVFPIHALHLFNVWLLWLIVRRMGVSAFAAGAGCLFFSFQMVAFDVYWKPMYVYDLLCTTFCLLSLLCYMRRWLVASFVAFWLAYKSKELAVMLPAVLFCYEYWFGQRRWRPLIPFFAVSLCFGLQGLLLNGNENNEYTFHFGPIAVFKTAKFYASEILLFPLVGFALPFVPLLTRDRRVWFGIAAMFLFFFPLAFLRYRVYDAYCYLPLAALAIACAGIAGTHYRALVVIFFLLWIPWNEITLRLDRRHTLAVADENRAYVAGIGQAAREQPEARTFVDDGAPFGFNRWGIEGALRIFYPQAGIRVTNIDAPDARQALASDRVVILSWDAAARKLIATAHRPGLPDASYITMNHATPLWQLDQGWYGLENQFRWTHPDATAHLRRPAQARQFELIANISPALLRDVGRTQVQVRIDGQLVGSRQFTEKGWQTVRWDLAPAPAGNAQVAFHAEPAYHPAGPDPRVLGAAIVAFGFVPAENP